MWKRDQIGKSFKYNYNIKNPPETMGKPVIHD
jgi:hypothetical protein